MLVAFFDESVSSIGTQDYVIAGYVQTAEVWSDFSDEWAQVLDAAPTLTAPYSPELEQRESVDLGSG
jgi:hypothetical protein